MTRALAKEGMNVVAGARKAIDELLRLADEFPVHPVSVDLS